jgi:hypothetical protein
VVLLVLLEPEPAGVAACSGELVVPFVPAELAAEAVPDAVRRVDVSSVSSTDRRPVARATALVTALIAVDFLAAMSADLPRGPSYLPVQVRRG